MEYTKDSHTSYKIKVEKHYLSQILSTFKNLSGRKEISPIPRNLYKTFFRHVIEF